MASNYDATVTAFYVAYYGRPADPEGLAFWSQALEQSNGDFGAIVSAFSSSAEATTRFGDESASERIADIYQQLFDRAPDADGLAFWLKAIENGDATLADIAIQVVNGAQTTDLALSTLRQDAAAQFTAAVEASGVAYDGYAAIEAARVLVAAVKPGTDAAAVQSLVAASTALVQTAHDHPDVIAALAAGGQLSAVLATSGGKADALGTINALTSIAKAAVADPTALATLQQNGGMTGLLNSLPSGTSLEDLKNAVDKGGLGSAVDIVVPPAPPAPEPDPVPEPVAGPKVQLVVDTGFDTTDHVTANGQIQVSGLKSGWTWQYSTNNGVTWTTGPAATDGTALLDTSGFGVHRLQVRGIDASGTATAITRFTYDIEPTIAFTTGSGVHLASDTLVTNSIYYFIDVGGRAKGMPVVFQVSETGAADSWVNVSEEVQLADGLHYVRYLVTDANGKSSPSNALKLVMDSTLASPTVQLVADTGNTAVDKLTNDGHVKIGGLKPGVAWIYSTDGGRTFTPGPLADDKGEAILDSVGDGARSLVVRTVATTDGKTAFTSTQFDYKLDTSAPAQGLKLVSIEGAAEGSTHTNLAQADVVFSYTGTMESGDAIFYHIGNGGWVLADATVLDTANKTLTLKDIDLSKGDVEIRIDAKDAAGNLTQLVQKIDGPYTAFTTKATGDGIVLQASKDGNVYLTDGSTVAQLHTGGTDGNAPKGVEVSIGIQEHAAQGILGVGPSISSHSDQAGITYGFGSAVADTLSGSYVWGYDGDDMIYAIGTADNTAYASTSVIVGGKGADTIDATIGGSRFIYGSTEESSIVASDEGKAHGFDTIVFNTSTDAADIKHVQVFDFALKIDGTYMPIASVKPITGDETGNQLLALINDALVQNNTRTFPGNGKVSGTFIDFSNAAGEHTNFLVIDADGNGLVDAADYVIKLVGTIDAAESRYIGDSGTLFFTTA